MNFGIFVRTTGSNKIGHADATPPVVTYAMLMKPFDLTKPVIFRADTTDSAFDCAIRTLIAFGLADNSDTPEPINFKDDAVYAIAEVNRRQDGSDVLEIGDFYSIDS